MTWPVSFDDKRIDLHVSDRIGAQDAARQMATVRELLRRLRRQPGVILADEVGMGKTFVALAVAASVAWEERGRRPVVVMIPSALSDKWPVDLEVFRQRCLLGEGENGETSLTYGVARRGVEFLRLLDDPKSTRKHIIFLTHGALSASLQDAWTRLAILKWALMPTRFRKQRESFPRFAAAVLRQRGRFGDEELYRRLMKTQPRRWKDIINEYARDRELLEDDPVPEAIVQVLKKGKVRLTALRAELGALPLRESAYLEERIQRVRKKLVATMQDVWQRALVEAKVRSPLLILDEAHHLKNPSTRLASLFVEDESRADMVQVTGALSGSFERMLFLTATPFQLGHEELLRVLDRFQGVRWDKRTIPTKYVDFEQQMTKLSQALNETYSYTSYLDEKWGKLKPEDLRLNDDRHDDAESWWQQLQENGSEEAAERVKLLLQSYGMARDKIRSAEKLLRPWVIRHRRPRRLPGVERPRRRRFNGAGIDADDEATLEGLGIRDQSVLPFLLAARSQSILMRMSTREAERVAGRATFAEGLASSYEAFLETRRSTTVDDGELVDEDTTDGAGVELSLGRDRALTWYLNRLRKALPGGTAHAEHPKIQATVRRVLTLWKQGEKVLVFCHFRATGRALERHLSAAFSAYFLSEVARRTGCALADAERRLENLRSAYDAERSVRTEFDAVMTRIVSDFPELSESEGRRVTEAARSLVRTPSFLIRYFPLEVGRRQAGAFERAITETDGSGLSLQRKLRDFVEFLARRCSGKEREKYLEAVETIRLGERNVRLANGGTGRQARQNLMLTFNSPFFPEVLVASAVLAEGVDLHRYCRYVIHHDLCWNPSTLEQRTGRIDRINAKAEQVKQPIHVYLPYLAGTQDEKMFRVVRDRERWFQVIMGEDYRLDEKWGQEIAERVPLPEAAARELAFRLEV